MDYKCATQTYFFISRLRCHNILSSSQLEYFSSHYIYWAPHWQYILLPLILGLFSPPSPCLIMPKSTTTYHLFSGIIHLSHLVFFFSKAGNTCYLGLLYSFNFNSPSYLASLVPYFFILSRKCNCVRVSFMADDIPTGTIQGIVSSTQGGDSKRVRDITWAS